MSQNLTTAGNDSHALYTWLDKADAKHKASSLRRSSSTLTRFKMSKASTRLHKRDTALALTKTSNIKSFSSSSTSLVTSIKIEVPDTPLTLLTTPRSQTLPLPAPATKYSRYSEFLTQELANRGELQGNPLTPSKSSVFTTSGFGKPDLDHSFMSDASFEHTLINLFKSGFISSQDRLFLMEYHPLFQVLHKMLLWSRHCDFLTLRDPIDSYSEQKFID